MYFNPIDKPQALQYRSPEHRRVFEQHMRNIKRLIDYQNKRCLLNLRPVSYPEALLIVPYSYAWPLGLRAA